MTKGCDRTLHALVADHAAARPHSRAVADVDGALSFGELHARGEAVAAALAHDGVRRGDRLVFAGHNCIAIPILLLAASRIGAVLVPLNWRLSQPEMAEIVEDVAAKVVFFTGAYRALRPLVSTGLHVRWIPAEALCTEDRRSPAEPLDRFEDDADLPLAIIYTSGTSGRPKGVVLTQRNLLALNLARNEALEWDRWTPDDATLVAAPLGHIASLGMMIRALIFGAFVQIEQAFSAERTLAAVVEHRLTKLALVPTALQALLDHPAIATTDLSSVNSVTYGAAPIAPTLLDEAMTKMGVGLTQSYGLSESGGGSVCLSPADHDPERPHLLSSAGRPLPGCAVRIVNDGHDAPTGERGEIWLSTPGTMAGYWRRSADTAEALGSDGWLRTGDVGHLDRAGYLFISGRRSELIVSGGENVYPAEVEAALCAHPAIQAAAVFGMPDPRWGEIVAAAVIPRKGGDVAPDALADWVRSRIAGYKIPRRWFVKTALPVNANGKVNKQALREGCAPGT